MDLNDYLLLKQAENIHFWYRARVNLISSLLNYGFKDEEAGREIMVIGCGTGTEFDVIGKFGRITALDINEEAVAIVSQLGYKTILSDVEVYEFEKDHYDAVCCFDVLEHLHDDQRALSRTYNSLKKGGYLFFTVPAFQFLFSTHDIAMKHVRRYSKSEISKKIRHAGYEVIKLNYWNTIPFPFIALFRMTKKVLHLYSTLDSKNGEKEFQSEIRNINKYLNTFGYLVLNLENTVIWQSLPLPFGLTICGVAKKN